MQDDRISYNNNGNQPAPNTSVTPPAQQISQTAPASLAPQPAPQASPVNMQQPTMPTTQPGASLASGVTTLQPEANTAAEYLAQWQASDFIKHERSPQWYAIAVVVFIVVLLACVAAYLFKLLDVWSMASMIGLILMMFIAIIVSGKIPHRQVNYALTATSIIIDGKEVPLDSFRAFGLRNIGNVWQLVLIPTGRFSMETAVFIDQAVGERVVDILGSVLPMEDISDSLVDKVGRILKI